MLLPVVQETKANLPTSHGHYGSLAAVDDDTMVYMGGTRGNVNGQNAVISYSAAADAWTTRASMISWRW